MLAINILCIVAGVVYIIYQALKERHDPIKSYYTKTTFIEFAPTLIGIALTAIICAGTNSPWGIIPCVVGGIITIVGYRTNQPKTVSEHLQQANAWQKDLDEVCAHFANHPQFKLNRRHVRMLVYDSKSPLYNSWLGNYDDRECFDWVCYKEQTRLLCMSDEELGKRFGIPIHLIPLNQDIHKDDAIMQRRGWVVTKLLWHQGMNFNPRFLYYMNHSIDYIPIFNAFEAEYREKYHTEISMPENTDQSQSS